MIGPKAPQHATTTVPTPTLAVAAATSLPPTINDHDVTLVIPIHPARDKEAPQQDAPNTNASTSARFTTMILYNNT